MLVFEQDSTSAGSHFACSELCCHHRHGLYECVHTRVFVSVEARRVFQISWNWGYMVVSYLMWVLGTDLGSSAKAVHTLNH